MENQENEPIEMAELEQDAPFPKKEFMDSGKCMGTVFGLVFKKIF